MNWRRGLFRLWLIGSAVWIGGVLAVAAQEKAIPSLMIGCSALHEFVLEDGQKPGPDYFAQCEGKWREERLRLFALVIAPPVGAFILAVALTWIGRGFKPSGPN